MFLHELVRALIAADHEVFVVAPRVEQSWTGASKSRHRAVHSLKEERELGCPTWSVDGTSLGHEFRHLTAEERRIGYHFMTSLPSQYVVAHVDHVRSTRLLPLGPEETELSVEWLFPRETLADPSVDIQKACAFSSQVLAEDGAVCERNQRGLRAARHEGVLMPEEYEVYRLHQWLRAELARP